MGDRGCFNSGEHVGGEGDDVLMSMETGCSPAVVMADSMSNPSSNASSRTTSPLFGSEACHGALLRTTIAPSVAAAAASCLPNFPALHQHQFQQAEQQQQRPQQSSWMTTQAQQQEPMLLRTPTPLPLHQQNSNNSNRGGVVRTDNLERKEEEDAVQALHGMSSALVAAISPDESVATRPLLGVNDDFAAHMAMISETTTAPVVRQPSPLDVVLEDNPAQPMDFSERAVTPTNQLCWRNNAAFAEMVASHAEAFSAAPLSTQALIVQTIALQIQNEIGGRFLERHKVANGWKEVSGQPLFLGIARALFQQVQLKVSAVELQQNANSRSSSLSSLTAGPHATSAVTASHRSAPSSDTQTPSTTAATLPAFHDTSALSNSTASANPNSVLNLYLDSIWSSETMMTNKKGSTASAGNDPGIAPGGAAAAGTESTDGSTSNAKLSHLTSDIHSVNRQAAHGTSSRMANVVLPMAASKNAASLTENHAAGQAAASPVPPKKVKVVKKKTKLIKKTGTAASSGPRKCTAAHNPDGTFAHKRASPIGFSEKRASPDNVPRKKANPAAGSSLVQQEQAANFDPETWFAEFGTLEAMNERAETIVPTLCVEVIPRGVTVRPSGKWQAQFYFDGQSRYIGVFDGSDGAALAYECVHRLLAGFRELSRMRKSPFTKALTKDETRTLFDNAREAAVKAVTARQKREQQAIAETGH